MSKMYFEHSLFKIRSFTINILLYSHFQFLLCILPLSFQLVNHSHHSGLNF